VAEYESVCGPLRRQADGASRHDALHGQPQRQAQRDQAVAQAVGHATAEEMWHEIVNGYDARFIAAYVRYLQC
jgi:hypothetical protein